MKVIASVIKPTFNADHELVYTTDICLETGNCLTLAAQVAVPQGGSATQFENTIKQQIVQLVAKALDEIVSENDIILFGGPN